MGDSWVIPSVTSLTEHSVLTYNLFLQWCMWYCPKVVNPDQADDDEDTFGNVCDNNDDSDRDGIPDVNDNCVSDPNADQLDTGIIIFRIRSNEFVKFRCYEKATKIWKKIPTFLTFLSKFQKRREIFSNSVAFSQFFNFFGSCLKTRTKKILKIKIVTKK